MILDIRYHQSIGSIGYRISIVVVSRIRSRSIGIRHRSSSFIQFIVVRRSSMDWTSFSRQKQKEATYYSYLPMRCRSDGQTNRIFFSNSSVCRYHHHLMHHHLRRRRRRRRRADGRASSGTTDPLTIQDGGGVVDSSHYGAPYPPPRGSGNH